MASTDSEFPGLSYEIILKKISEITLQIQQGRELGDILQTAITNARTLLDTDRVLIYRLFNREEGSIDFESVHPEWASLLGQRIDEPCFHAAGMKCYSQGEMSVISDVGNQVGSSCYAALLQRFQVRATLVVPILNQGTLWGLLIAHHCRSPRDWSPIEVHYFQQVALHLSVATQQAELRQEQQHLVAEQNPSSASSNLTPQQVEAALQEHQYYYEQILDAVQDLVFCKVPGSILTYANRAMCDYYGMTLAELRGATDGPRNPLDFAQQYIQDDLHVFTTGTVVDRAEEPIRRADGEVRYFHTIKSPIFDADGRVSHVVGVARDITQRKHAENWLRRYERIVSATPDCVSLIDRNYIYQIVNQAYLNWTQKSYNEIVGNPVSDVLGQAFFETFVQPKLDRCLAGNPLQTFEGWRDYEDGQRRYFRATYTPYIELDGSISGVVVNVHDLTELKRTEEALRDSETRLNLAVQSAKIGIWDWDVVNDRLFWDDRMYELYGVQPSQSGEAYSTWENSIHPDDLLKCRQATQQALAGEQDYAIEFRVIMPDGTMRHITSYALIQRAADRTPLRMIGINLDISAHKASEAALREQQQLTEQIAESTLAILYIYDLVEQRNVYCNQQIEAVLGYSPEEIQAMGNAFFPTLIHPDDLPQVIENQQELFHIQDNEFVELEYRIRHKSGSYRWFLSRGRILNRTSEGSPKHIVGVAVDITTFKETQAALHQQTERERLLMAIAHKIRQTLDLAQILHTAATEVRQLLQVSRVAIYRFEANWNSMTVAESVAAGWHSILGMQITDPCIKTQNQSYLEGQVTAIDDIYMADLDTNCIELLEAMQVRAKLIVPILQNDYLWGVLVAHHCQQPRHWESFEIILLQQLATQLAIALKQSELYQQVQALNTDLELQVQERTAQLQQALEFEALLKRITDQVRDSLDEDKILQHVVKELAIAINADCCDTAIYDVDRNAFNVKYKYNQDGFGATDTVCSMAESSDPNLYAQLFQGQYGHFCLIGRNAVRPDQPRAAILAVPILDDQGLLGDMWLFKPPHKLFNAQEIRLVQQVANQCAIALRQSRLYQAVQAKVQELEQLNQLKDDFLSTVSHELRSPMSNIKMAIQMLEISLNRLGALTGESSSTHRYFKILREEGEREINLINDLLDLARLDARNQPLQLTAVNLRVHIPHLVEKFVERMHQQQQQLILQIPTTLPYLTTDESYLDRILTELLHNACKYTPSGETITVSVQTTSTALKICVGNSGVEIAPEERARIFDKFYRIPNSDPWKHGGTGLGLALVKKLTEQLSGSIHVESKEEQTTFVLTFLTPL